VALASDLRFGRWFLFRRLPLVPVPLGVRSGKAKELYRYRATRGAGSNTSGGLSDKLSGSA
jgi:hypothetical protein